MSSMFAPVWKWIAGAAVTAGHFVFGEAYDYKLIIIVLILMGIDLVTGVAAAKRRDELIVSAGFYRTVLKLFSYAVALVTVQLTFSLPPLNIGRDPAVIFLLGMTGLTEAKSIAENLDKLGYPLSKWLLQTLNTRIKALSKPEDQ